MPKMKALVRVYRDGREYKPGELFEPRDVKDAVLLERSKQAVRVAEDAPLDVSSAKTETRQMQAEPEVTVAEATESQPRRYRRRDMMAQD